MAGRPVCLDGALPGQPVLTPLLLSQRATHASGWVNDSRARARRNGAGLVRCPENGLKAARALMRTCALFRADRASRAVSDVSTPRPAIRFSLAFVGEDSRSERREWFGRIG